MRAFAALLATLAGGCASAPVDATPDLGPSNALVAARPYEYQVPVGYDPAVPAPLVVLLHGYSATGFLQDAVFGFSAFADAHGLLYAFPDGTKDSRGNRFWNATDACCNFDDSAVDDVAYITAVIDDMSARFAVDPKRVYLTGHSNGGFMSHRMACERSSRIAAIVALAGDNWLDPAKCAPSEPVAVLQVHGDADDSVLYAGEPNLPSAHDSVASWARLNGCDPTPDASSPPIDLDTQLPGPETTLEKFPHCKPNSAAELWTIHGGPHVPHLSPTWPETIYTFMSSHPKP